MHPLVAWVHRASGVNPWKRCEKYLEPGPLIGQICSLPRRVAMTTSTTKLGGVRRVVLSRRYRSFTAWRQNECIIQFRKRKEQDEEKKHSQDKGTFFFVCLFVCFCIVIAVGKG